MQVLDNPVSEIVTLPPEGDESLALGDSTKNFIRDEIKTQLDQAIDKFNPHGARRVAQFLREWGLAGTLIVAPIALLAFAGAGWYYAFNRVDKEARFQTTTEARLKAIEEQLQGIRGDLAKQSVISHAALPLADFKATLPDLSSAIATAKQQNTKVPAQVMGDLQHKLSASVDAPDFWPTAAQFISYRSQIESDAIQRLARADLPKCADREPIPMSGIDHPEGVELVSAFYDDCQITLDSPEEAKRIFDYFENRAFLVTFRHCHIIWNGGGIALLTLPEAEGQSHKGYFMANTKLMAFEGRYLRFGNSLLSFVLPSAPPSDGQQFTRELLSQSGETLAFPLPAPSVHS